MDEQIKKAAEVIINGGIVIFPTDTAFGIGCRIDDEDAVSRLFEIRNRPKNKATPVLVASIEMAQEYLLSIPRDVVENLMKKYWPGGLTIVLPCKENKVPALVRGGGSALGVRIPNHSVTLETIKQVGVPILGPSANLAGEKTPYNTRDIDKRLMEKVDYVVNGETTMKNVSTVIDCTSKPWKIIRQGAVKVSSKYKVES